MIDQNWSARHITDSAQCILKQIPARASDRGLSVVDGSSLVTLALWSLLLWERKVGRVALERIGVDPFELARGVDRVLTEYAEANPVAFDPRSGGLLLVKTGEPYERCDFHALLEPLLRQAEVDSPSMTAFRASKSLCSPRQMNLGVLPCRRQPHWCTLSHRSAHSAVAVEPARTWGL